MRWPPIISRGGVGGGVGRVCALVEKKEKKRKKEGKCGGQAWAVRTREWRVGVGRGAPFPVACGENFRCLVQLCEVSSFCYSLRQSSFVTHCISCVSTNIIH